MSSSSAGTVLTTTSGTTTLPSLLAGANSAVASTCFASACMALGALLSRFHGPFTSLERYHRPEPYR